MTTKAYKLEVMPFYNQTTCYEYYYFNKDDAEYYKAKSLEFNTGQEHKDSRAYITEIEIE